MLRFKKLALSLPAILFTALCLAQEGPYRVEIDEPVFNSGYAGVIRYIDQATGEVAKVIDLNELNPMNSLELPEPQYNPSLGFPLYDLTIWDLSKCLPDIRQYNRYQNNDALYNRLLNRELLPADEYARIVREKGAKFVPNIYAWGGSVVTVSNGYPQVNYTLFFRYSYSALANITWLYVFSGSGEICYQVKSYDYIDPAHSSITANGEFLMYIYGSDMDEDGFLSDANGFRVIDMKNRTVLLEKNYPMDVSIGIPSNEGRNYFISNLGDSVHEILLIFPEEGVIAHHANEPGLIKEVLAPIPDNVVIRKDNRGDIVEIVVKGEQFTLEVFK